MGARTLNILWQDEQCEISLHGERVVAIVCACDVIQTKSSMGSIGPFGTVRPQESASAHHDKMHESRTPWTWRRAWQLSTLVGVGDAHKGVGIVVTSALA